MHPTELLAWGQSLVELRGGDDTMVADEPLLDDEEELARLALPPDVRDAHRAWSEGR